MSHLIVGRPAHADYFRAAKLVAAAAVLVAVIGACPSDPFEPPLGPPIHLPPRPPIRYVSVHTWPTFVQEADTLRVDAEGFDSTGFAFTEPVRTAEWRVHPTGIVALEPASALFPSMSSRYARGLTPGGAWVVATLNGVTDSGRVEVLPRLDRIELSPSAVSMDVGDTATLTARVITANGDDLAGASLIWRISHPNALNYGARGERTLSVIGRAPATATVTVSLARVSTAATVTVTDPAIVRR